jgi:hypothetical protein
MTDIELAADYDGISGKFKYRGSFPLVLEPCNYLVDRIKLKKEVHYVSIHGGIDGNVQISILNPFKQ